MKFSLINLAPSFLLDTLNNIATSRMYVGVIVTISNVIPTIFLVYVCSQGGGPSILNLVRGERLLVLSSAV